MPANTSPISPIAPATSWQANSPTLTANTAMDGTGAINVIHTAGANGSRVGRIRVQPWGTNADTNIRFFVNNGSTNTTAGNNSLINETYIDGTTKTENTAWYIAYDIPLNIVMKPGYRLFYTTGTTIAAGLAVTCVDAGDY